MNITTLKQCLPYLMQAKITPWLWGYHGRGKSQFVENYFESIGWLCFNFRLGTQADVGDLLGQSDFDIDDQGNRYTTFRKPEWMHKAFEFCEQNPDKGAVIFLDEVNRIMRQDLIPPVFQMALDYRLHTYKFPKNLHVIVAANPETSNYKVTKFRDKAFYDRFCHIKFEPTVNEWMQHLSEVKCHNDIVGFLQEQPEFIEEENLDDFSISEYISPSRRTWLALDRVYKFKAPKEVISNIALGMVGAEGVAAWSNWLAKGGKPLLAEEILNKYKEVRPLVLKYSDMSKEESRSDIIKITCDNLSTFLTENPDHLNHNPECRSNVNQFMKDIPGEVLFDFGWKTGAPIIDLLNTDPELLDILRTIKGKKGSKEISK